VANPRILVEPRHIEGLRRDRDEGPGSFSIAPPPRMPILSRPRDVGEAGSRRLEEASRLSGRSVVRHKGHMAARSPTTIAAGRYGGWSCARRHHHPNKRQAQGGGVFPRPGFSTLAPRRRDHHQVLFPLPKEGRTISKSGKQASRYALVGVFVAKLPPKCGSPSMARGRARVPRPARSRRSLKKTRVLRKVLEGR